MNLARPSRRSFLKTAAAVSLLSNLPGGGLFVRNLRAATALEPANDAIRGSREIALSILKPTRAQVEHGFELHASSVVFESYGFAPRAAIDGHALNAAIEGGASGAELSDLREEMMLTRCATDQAERDEFLEAFRAAGVTCVFQNAGEEGNDPMRLSRRLAWFTFVTDTLRGVVNKVVRAEDVVRTKKNNELSLCLSTNGVPLPNRRESVRDELALIRVFHRLGVRMMHLTYNRRNPIGDGVGEPNDGGISDFGRQVIAEMNRLGVIVDVAHSGWRSSLEAARLSAKPMVASHTTCAGLHRHFRGKPDEVIKAICDTGGLIGICCIPRFLGGTGDIAAFLDHIDYAVKRFGPDHVAIGTDVAYISRNSGRENARVKGGGSTGGRASDRWEQLWPPEHTLPAAGTGTILPLFTRSMAWTNFPLFTVGMIQRGHTDSTIQKILGGNVLRVLRANET
jgi:membrane dipeptidase